MTYFIDQAGHRLRMTGDFWHHDQRYLKRDVLGNDHGYDCPVTKFMLEEERMGMPIGLRRDPMDMAAEIALEVG